MVVSEGMCIVYCLNKRLEDHDQYGKNINVNIRINQKEKYSRQKKSSSTDHKDRLNIYRLLVDLNKHQ